MLYASFLLSMTACDSTSIPLEELRDEGVELPELPGRDPDEAEQEELRSLFQSLTRARSREQAPPWVRVVPAGEFQSALANYSTALRLEVEETALQLLGLLPPGESLISARSSTYQVARWDPSAGVLWVQEEAIGTPAMELGLAQSLTASCQPSASGRDARLTAHALSLGMAQVVVLARLAEQSGSTLLDAHPNAEQVSEGILANKSWFSEIPALQDEDIWSLSAGTRLSLLLYRAGAWRSLDKSCEEPPAVSAALLHPRAWEEGLELSPVGTPKVPIWEQEGWKAVGQEHLGEQTLGSLLEALEVPGARRLASSWRGDSLQLFQREGELRAAWTLGLSDPANLQELYQGLKGKTTLPSGYELYAQRGQGNTLHLLIGAEGEAQGTQDSYSAGGDWPHKLPEEPSQAQTISGQRQIGSRVSFESGDAKIGSLKLRLGEGWRELPLGVDGNVLTLYHRSSGVRLEISRLPALLAGSAEQAASTLARVALKQRGISEQPKSVKRSGHQAARAMGSDSRGLTRSLEVLAVPLEEDLLLVQGSWKGAGSPAGWNQILAEMSSL